MYTYGTYETILQQLDPSQPIFIDTETIKLYGKIRLGQFYQAHWPKVIFINRPKPIEFMVFLANQLKDVEQVYQNSPYDVSVVQSNTGSRFIPNKFEDTFYLA